MNFKQEGNNLTQRLYELFLEDKNYYNISAIYTTDDLMVLSDCPHLCDWAKEIEYINEAKRAKKEYRFPDYSNVKGLPFTECKEEIENLIQKNGFTNALYAEQGKVQIDRSFIGGLKALVLAKDPNNLKKYSKLITESFKLKYIEYYYQGLDLPINFEVNIDNTLVTNTASNRVSKDGSFSYKYATHFDHAFDEIRQSIQNVIERKQEQSAIEK